MPANPLSHPPSKSIDSERDTFACLNMNVDSPTASPSKKTASLTALWRHLVHWLRRKPAPQISTPLSVTHEVHVTHDTRTGVISVPRRPL